MASHDAHHSHDAHDGPLQHTDPHAPPVYNVAFPTWKTYKWVALVLTAVTAVEVWIFYTPFRENRLFAPALITMSIFKFVVVVLFYMHLRYDAKLFKALFTGPLIIAVTTVIALLFLFGHLTL